MTKILEQKIRNPYPIKEDKSDRWISLSEIDQKNNTTSIGLHGKLLDENSVTAGNLPTDTAIITSPAQITTATAIITSPNQLATDTAIISSSSQIATTTAIITDSSQLAAGIINNNHISGVSGAKIQDGTIDGSKIIGNTLSGNSFVNSSLNLNKLNTKLKGVLIDAINPDDMIIGDNDSKNILKFSLNNYTLDLSSNELPKCDFYLTTISSDGQTTSISSTFFMKISINSLNNNTTYSLEIPKVIIACQTNNNTYLYENKEIILNNSFTFKENNSFSVISAEDSIIEYPNFKILNEVYFKQYLQEYWDAFEAYISPFRDQINLDVENGTVSNFTADNLNRTWDWFNDTFNISKDDINSSYISYSSWLDFKNIMYLSQDDYDKLGIWIKI